MPPEKTQESTQMKGSPSLLLAAMLSLPLLANAAEPAQCSTVNFSDVGWTDITATTAATTLVAEALGYETETKVLSVPVTYTGLAEGDIDVFLGNWMPAQSELVQPHLDSGRIEKLHTNLPTVRYTLAVLTPGHEGGLKEGFSMV